MRASRVDCEDKPFCVLFTEKKLAIKSSFQNINRHVIELQAIITGRMRLHFYTYTVDQKKLTISER